MSTSEEGAVAAPTESSSGGSRVLGSLHEIPFGDREIRRLSGMRGNIFRGQRHCREQEGSSGIGGTVYGVLRNIVAPQNPISMSYDDVTTKLREHFDPKELAENLAELH